MQKVKAVSLVKYLANLGYGSRSEVERAIYYGHVTVNGAIVKKPRQKITPTEDVVLFKGETLDPEGGFVILMHKPKGLICTHEAGEPSIYQLLPERFRYRNPIVSSVGRLDKDTTGTLLLTDDGALLHHLISPKNHLKKIYRADLAETVGAEEKQAFASGTLMLRGEKTALLPAQLEILSEKQVDLTLIEGRYHQVKRMFGACGNKVEALHRRSFAGLSADNLAEGEWRFLSEEELVSLKTETGFRP